MFVAVTDTLPPDAAAAAFERVLRSISLSVEDLDLANDVIVDVFRTALGVPLRRYRLRSSLLREWPRGMRDISHVLRAASDAEGSLTRRDALDEAARRLGLQVGWEGGAGKEWASLVGADGTQAAYVSVHRPLAIVRTGSEAAWAATAVAAGIEVEMLVVDDFTSPVLRADQDVLERFMGHEVTSVIDPDGFSPDNLRFVSISRSEAP